MSLVPNHAAFKATPAVVSSTLVADRGQPRYLQLMPQGDRSWVKRPEDATAFASMREATRMAMRLPAHDKAFGMPLELELGARLCDAPTPALV